MTSKSKSRSRTPKPRSRQPASAPPKSAQQAAAQPQAQSQPQPKIQPQPQTQTQSTAQRPTPDEFDLVIVGGGMVGAALACACADLGFSIAVIDGQPPQRNWPVGDIDLRVSALSRASEELLRRLGAWPRMLELGVSPYREMIVWDAPDSGSRSGCGGGTLHFDSADLGEPDLGHIVENRVTRLALWEQLEQAENVSLLCPATVETLEIDSERARIRLDGNRAQSRRLTARLLIGADGRDSRVRAALGIGCETLLYDQQAIVARVTPGHWHRETAWQRFLPTGPLAFLPLADGRCSIVWSAEQGRAEELLALDDAAFAAELEHAFDHRLGPIHAVGPRASFGLRRSHAMRYFQGRAALIGDAAHAIHPLAGQGVNLGLLDVAALYDALAHARRHRRDIAGPAILRRYERARRADNQQMLLAMDVIKRLFSNHHPLLALGRGLGLSAVDRLVPLKRRLMREAMGYR